MDSDDGCSIGTASTDTSMFLKELQALNTHGTGPVTQSLHASTETMKGMNIEDLDNSTTLPEALETLRDDGDGETEKQLKQIIDFTNVSDEDSVGILDNDADIFVSCNSNLQQGSGSNKVKISTIVNHVWEHKFYYGNLVAVHRDCDFLAYTLKGASAGVVRVVSRRLAARSLLKCFTGKVLDISFALSNQIFLAAVDERGSLFVHSVAVDGDSIVSSMVLNVERDIADLKKDPDQQIGCVIWCPFIPDGDPGNMDMARTLVLLHGVRAEVWNLDLVNEGKMDGSLITSDQVTALMPNDKLLPVVNAAFAPDGSAIAVAFESGLVRFHLLELEEPNTPECMHEWMPHGHNTVSCLLFLDDHRHTSPDQQLWRFALTGALHNTEIKIWRCDSWSCVQTLTFHHSLQSKPGLDLRLKADIDLTAKYLVMSDINSRMLYILQLHQDFDQGKAVATSISKFSLAQNCISFAICDACRKRLVRSDEDSHLDEITTGELENEDQVKENGDSLGLETLPAMGVQIKMYAVNTKSFQEYLIRYRPETCSTVLAPPSVGSASQDATGLRDMLSDVSLDQSEASHDFSSTHDSSKSSIAPSHFLPSPQKASGQNGDSRLHEGRQSPGGATHISAASSTSSFTHVSAINEELADTPRTSFDPSSVTSPSSIFSQTPQKHSTSQLPPISSCDDDEDTTSSRHSAESVKSPKASPGQSLDTSEAQKEAVDNLFDSSWQPRDSAKALGESGESSSTIGKQEERYDENDQEVAATLGSTLMSEGFGGSHIKDGDSDKEEEEELIEEDEEEMSPSNTSLDEKRKEVVWPDPPDVSLEAKRLVSEVIQRSTEDEEKAEMFDDDDNDEAEIEEILPQVDPVEEEEDRNSYGDNAHIPSSSVVIQSQASEKALSSIERRLLEMTEKMLQQQEMLSTMHQELANQREATIALHRQQAEQQQLQQVAAQQSHQPSLQEGIGQLEDILVSRMEHSLAQHMHKETKRLQDSLSKSDQQRQVRDQSLQSGLVNDIGRSVRDTVASTLRTEIKQTVSPALHQFVEPMKDKIHQEVAQRLTACDSLLRDNISKAVKSRATMEVLAQSVGEVIYQQMQQAYSQTFQNSFLPSLTACMEKTVKDIHGVFHQGTKEYQLYIKQSVDFMLKEKAQAENLVVRMEEAQRQFSQSMAHMKSMLVTSIKDELAGQVGQAVASVKADVVREVHHLLRQELTTAMEGHKEVLNEQLSLMRSTATTPVPGALEEDMVREKIHRELRNNQPDRAFQTALSAESLEMVVYVCQAVSHLNLFAETPCPLTQPVLLSLISQLSGKLDQEFDLKMRFLSDAVMNLDTENARTADHIPSVLTNLMESLTVASKSVANDPRKVKEIRMLIMAARSLLAMRT